MDERPRWVRNAAVLTLVSGAMLAAALSASARPAPSGEQPPVGEQRNAHTAWEREALAWWTPAEMAKAIEDDAAQRRATRSTALHGQPRLGQDPPLSDGAHRLQQQPPALGEGQPGTGVNFPGVKQVGTFFIAGTQPGEKHVCTGTVVGDAQIPMILSSAHCFVPLKAKVVFVPGFFMNRGVPQTPHGVWPVDPARRYVDPLWNPHSQARVEYDQALLVPGTDAQGRSLSSVVPGFPLLIGAAAAQARAVIVGYPEGFKEGAWTYALPRHCRNASTSYYHAPSKKNYASLACTGMNNGVSGGPLLLKSVSGWIVAGVIGGPEQGGSTPDHSYAVMFNAILTRLMNRVVAANTTPAPTPTMSSPMPSTTTSWPTTTTAQPSITSSSPSATTTSPSAPAPTTTATSAPPAPPAPTTPPITTPPPPSPTPSGGPPSTRGQR